MQRLQQGWRRFGWAMFRPECPSCRMCQSLRVPVAAFRPNASQRRAWKRNEGEVTVRVGAPALSQDRLELWARFHRHGRETKGWPLGAPSDPEMLFENPIPHKGVDLLPAEPADRRRLRRCPARGPLRDHRYYDPTEGACSLGTSNTLTAIIVSSANH
jgi:leucyl-tRNA---protein transferase